MNDTILNMSTWVVSLNGTSAAHAFQGRQYEVLTTQDILDLCGAMDANALFAAGLGIVVSIAFMFYLSRWRVKCSKVQRKVIDKAALTLLAMLFVGIIVRIARAG